MRDPAGRFHHHGIRKCAGTELDLAIERDCRDDGQHHQPLRFVLNPGATVNLTRGGQADITATNVGWVSSNRFICRFDIPSGAEAGTWNVVLTNPDGQFAILGAPSPSMTRRSHPP